jgi:hypothetical protein
MSKQSRQKSRRHSHKRGTGAVATFEQSIGYMPEHRVYNKLSDLLNELHKVLCDRRTFKSPEFISSFYLREWDKLEKMIACKNSVSENRDKALELIPKIVALFNRCGDKNMIV